MAALQSRTLAEYLGHEFARRKQRNGAYSMRAFARDLELSASRLSEVMSGKHGLSESSIDSIAKKLSQKAKEQQFLKDLVLSEFSRNAKVREMAKLRVDDARQVDQYVKLREEQFRVISEWYHGAILQLTEVKDFNPDPKWIAERIGLSHSTVSAALSRLERLGLIQKDKKNGWRSLPQGVTAFSDIPSAAVRKFHMQVLAKSMESVKEDSSDERESLSTFVAVPRARMDEFRDELRRFVDQFWRRFAEEEKDDLYSLTLQFCPVKNRIFKGENK